MSRAVTRRRDGRSRKLKFIDVKNAHGNPRCEEDVYLELPEECHCLDVWYERSRISMGEALCR
eukprot:8975040-Karenia_brevis.AAC.1